MIGMHHRSNGSSAPCSTGFQPVSCVLAHNRASETSTSTLANAIVRASTHATLAGSPCYRIRPVVSGVVIVLLSLFSLEAFGQTKPASVPTPRVEQHRI